MIVKWSRKSILCIVMISIILIYYVISLVNRDIDKSLQDDVKYVLNGRVNSNINDQYDFEVFVKRIIKLIDRNSDGGMAYYLVTVVFKDCYIRWSHIQKDEDNPMLIMLRHNPGLKKSPAFRILCAEVDKIIDGEDWNAISGLRDVQDERKYCDLCRVLILRCIAEAVCLEWVKGMSMSQEERHEREYLKAMENAKNSIAHNRELLFACKMIEIKRNLRENLNNKAKVNILIDEWHDNAMRENIEKITVYENPYPLYEAVTAVNMMVRLSDKLSCMLSLVDRLNDNNDPEYIGYRGYLYLEIARIYLGWNDYDNSLIYALKGKKFSNNIEYDDIIKKAESKSKSQSKSN